MSHDLTCNETLGVEDSERNKEGIVRRFPAPSSATTSAFRANYNASVSSVKHTIQKPAAKLPFLTTNPASHIPYAPGTSAITSSDDHPHGQLSSASHAQHQNSTRPKIYKAVSNNPEYPSAAGISPSQLQIFAGSTLLRSAVAAAGYRDDRPTSNSDTTHALTCASQLQTNAMQANIYNTINNMRLQQQQPQAPPNPDKSPGAVALAAVHAAATARTTIETLRHGVYHPQVMYRSIVPHSPHQATLLPRPTITPPNVANRYTYQNGAKQCVSPKLVRPQSAAHYVIPHQTVAASSRIITGHGMGHSPYHLPAPPMANVSGSPGTPQPIQQIISTPSPRPSILRKRGDGSIGGSAAKRRLPFMDETPNSSSNVTQQNAQAYNVGSAPPVYQLNKETLNGAAEESPRKRLRKQQFERDAIPEQIKMAIDVVQPVAGGSGAWKFAGHSGFVTPGVSEKKKRGRPRANPRPATALPIELHKSVSVFVDIDSPEEKLKPAIVPEQSSISRGLTASVPPVHIEVPETKKMEAEESQIAINLVPQQGSNCESTQRKQINRRKDRATTSKSAKAQANVLNPRSSAEINSDSSSKGSSTVEEQQQKDVTGFLAACLQEKRMEERIKQRTRELDQCPSRSKTNLDVVPQIFTLSNASACSQTAKQTWPKSTSLPSNHFETVKEFHAIYEQYRKLKLLQRRGIGLCSSINMRETVEKCVENCDSNMANTSNFPGLKPVKPMNVAEKNQLVSFVENVVMERLKKAKVFNSNSTSTKRRLVGDDSRLPVVFCEHPCSERLAPVSFTSGTEGVTSSANNDVEQLLDEMISFITLDESCNPLAECAERTFTRSAIGRNSELCKRRRTHTQVDTFASILKNLRSSSCESREIFDNVFITGPTYFSRSWWNVVTSRKIKRTRGRKLLSKTSIPEFPKSDSTCCLSNFQLPDTNDDLSTEFSSASLREEVAVRLQHMDRQLSEQIRFEERLLEIFERFYGIYNPKDYFKMKLDMELDIDEGDSPATVYQKKIQRLRFVLSLPPCKLPQDRKPDFGEQCASVISCPNETEMNRHMMGISPFWRGPLIKSNRKCFYLTRTGRRMHNKDESFVPLEDDYREFFLEDLMDYRDPALFQKHYSTMEQVWAQLQQFRISPPEPLAKSDDRKGDFISRRTLSRCRDNDVVCVGSLQTDVLQVLNERNNLANDEEVEEFLKMGESTKEILATAFKAIRQTTLMMIQTRNALLELVHNVGENCNGEDEDDEQDESVDDEDSDFNRQLEQAIQESCQELQSTSKM